MMYSGIGIYSKAIEHVLVPQTQILHVRYVLIRKAFIMASNNSHNCHRYYGMLHHIWKRYSNIFKIIGALQRSQYAIAAQCD